MRKELKPYLPVARAVETLLHPHAEVVIHDLRMEKIAAICNPFSNRQVGDDSLLGEIEKLPDFFEPYTKVEIDGRQMRSVSAAIRDRDGELTGLLCINLDLSAFAGARALLDTFLGALQPQPDALFADDWRERINQFVATYLRQRQRSLPHLAAAEKRELILALREAGAFDAKRAAAYIANALGIARSTVYKYLKRAS